MNRLIPKSLVGRVIALLLLALTLIQLINVLIFVNERGEEIRATKVSNLTARTASIIRLLDGTPKDLHQGILQAITTSKMHFWFSGNSPIAQRDGKYLTDQRFAELANVSSNDIRIVLDQVRTHQHQTNQPMATLQTADKLLDLTQSLAIISIARSPDVWLNAVQLASTPSHAWRSTLLQSLTFMAMTLAIVIIVVRRLTRPLAQLTAATDRLGRGEEVALLPEHGAQDIRRSIRAFNQMRERLLRFVDDRTRMLAAISHDLRTPLTSLRLQTEFIDDAAMRKKMIVTINEMQHITEASLAFSRDDAVKEATRMIDLNALIDSLCHDLSDMGNQVTFESGVRAPYRCRPSALTRAIRNVIENAVNYGEGAWVKLQCSDKGFMIIIEDQGAGIATDQFEKVFAPFYRLESSRNLATGGIGLGLSIARSLVHSHGGEISLANRVPQGLAVTVSLPRQHPEV